MVFIASFNNISAIFRRMALMELIKTQISELVCTTPFCDNHHQSRNIGKTNKFKKSLVAIKPTGQKQKQKSLNTQIHDHSLYMLGTGMSIKTGGVKLVLWAQTFPLSEIMWTCKHLPRVSKTYIYTRNSSNREHYT